MASTVLLVLSEYVTVALAEVSGMAEGVQIGVGNRTEGQHEDGFDGQTDPHYLNGSLHRERVV